MPFTFNFGGFNPGDFGQGGERPQRERKPRKPIGTPVTRTLINIAVTALVGLVYFYVELPALNPHAEEFYFFVFLLCAVYCGCAVLTSGFQGTGARGYFGFVKKQCTIPFFVVIAMIAAIEKTRRGTNLQDGRNPRRRACPRQSDPGPSNPVRSSRQCYGRTHGRRAHSLPPHRGDNRPHPDAHAPHPCRRPENPHQARATRRGTPCDKGASPPRA